MIIAEVGLNHTGKWWIAKKFVTDLIETDVDAITFQIRENEFHENPPNDHFIWDRLDLEYYDEFLQLTHDAGKQFGMAVYEMSDVEYFAELGVDFFKMLSMHFMDDRIVEVFEATTVPIYLSTGMASFEDIQERLEGDLKKYVDEGRLRLIHTQLSHDEEDTNLLAISTLQELGVPVAYGNHLPHPISLYAALMLNPSDIFFYVHNGLRFVPDYVHALAIERVPQLMDGLNHIITVKGNGKKVRIVNKLVGEEE